MSAAKYGNQEMCNIDSYVITSWLKQYTHIFSGNFTQVMSAIQVHFACIAYMLYLVKPRDRMS